ncbi:MAG TPA: sigma-70 family RNA polymerase sigma factor [Planctomycetota bacterium]|nr:sigma-70 family RNA polymerase sigma factor [Planctomycetota bacterium]
MITNFDSNSSPAFKGRAFGTPASSRPDDSVPVEAGRTEDGAPFDAESIDACESRELTPNEEFISLLTAHHRRLLHYIMTLLPNRQDAEDLLQETTIVLFQKFSQFKPGTSFFAWAARIAYLKVQNLRRCAAPPAVLFDEQVLSALSEEAIEESHTYDLSESLRSALQECLGKLAAGDRALVLRRYEIGATGKSLAQEFNRPENSISKSLGRIRIALLNCVERKVPRTGGAA